MRELVLHLGIGANLDDPVATLADATAAIATSAVATTTVATAAVATTAASVSDSTSASVTSCAADSAAAATAVVPMISSALGRGECERGAKGMAAEPNGKPRASRGETRPEMSMGERFDGAYTA
jgi:hypothetical protein